MPCCLLEFSRACIRDNLHAHRTMMSWRDEQEESVIERLTFYMYMGALIIHRDYLVCLFL